MKPHGALGYTERFADFLVGKSPYNELQDLVLARRKGFAHTIVEEQVCMLYVLGDSFPTVSQESLEVERRFGSFYATCSSIDG